jgi:hypothetical protein
LVDANFVDLDRTNNHRAGRGAAFLRRRGCGDEYDRTNRNN